MGEKKKWVETKSSKEQEIMAAPWLYFLLLGVFSAVLQLLYQNNKMAGGLGPVMPFCF